jgi:hypothetical protein
LLTQEAPEQPWHGVEESGDVFSRDTLLVLPGMQAVIEPRPESIRLTLWGNLPILSPFPGLESSVVLHDSRAYDVDLTLLRGRIVLTNAKSKGPARAWIRAIDGAGEITLAEPGDEVALEIYGRWPRGVPFSREGRERPTTSLAILALKGQVDLQARTTRHRLTAPPGPAYFHWDSAAGPDAATERRDRLPAWADPEAKKPEAASAVAQIADAFRAAASTKGPVGALTDMLAEPGTADEKDKWRQGFAVLGLAALGDIEPVIEALADPRRPFVRTTAVLALRHWIGDSAGRDQQLYHLLISRLNYSKAQAETVLQLLHSPFAADQPETYQTLIAYLQHGRPTVRELAWWHLSRLVAADQVVPYDSTASPEDRARAAEAWKQLIPSGSLPKKKD